MWLLAASVALTLVVGFTAYATRETRAPGPHDAAPAPRLVHGPDYVAIGDSFTAGGPIGTIQAGAEDCVRSRDDYPTQVAERTGLSLTDVSCGGATTRDVLEGNQKERRAPQLESVTPRTKLVTVSVGGNDHAIYVTAFVNCLRYAKITQVGSPCKTNFGQAFASRLPMLQQSLTRVLAAVQQRAPNARVMLVTYLRLLPDTDVCAELPYPVGDAAWVTHVERSLAHVMRQAAASRGVEVVDMHRLSDGHDACSADPWVNGLRPKLGDGWFLHPNAAGAKAVAKAVTAAWHAGPPVRR